MKEKYIGIRVSRQIEKYSEGGKDRDPYFIKKIRKIKKLYRLCEN